MLRILILALISTPAISAEYEFCWIGENGYRLDGRMTLADDAEGKSLVTEEDVTRFKIAGTRNGIPLGTWSLSDLTPSTSWNLNFDPQNMMFLTGGLSGSSQGQEWNANGNVNNCGENGFGFNSGNIGQDVCVDGEYRIDSSIYEATPFPVYAVGTLGTCSGTPLLGSLFLNQQNAT